MEAAKKNMRMAGELLWFVGVSLLVGLVTALAAAAVVILLAKPAYAAGGTPALHERLSQDACAELLAEDRSSASHDCSHAFVLVLGRQEELDRLGLECESGLEGGVHPAEHGFVRLIDRERRELSELFREVGVRNELTDEAHVIRLAGAEDLGGQDVAHCLVFADRARETLLAAIQK
jgi:hypothetical protein